MLYHFSENPGIERFVPHVPVTNPDHPPAVWAINVKHSPLYWFPRDCPRATVWNVTDDIPGGRTSSSPGIARVEALGDLVELHEAAGIELHFVDNLWPTIDWIAASGLPFSIVRKHLAQPRITHPQRASTRDADRNPG